MAMRATLAAALAATLCLRNASATRRNFRSSSDSSESEFGLQLPEEEIDFSIVRPSPLVAVDGASADVCEQAAAAHQVTHAVISADLKGHLSLVVRAAGSDAAAAPAAESLIPVAWATYNDSVNQNGWAHLSVSATEDQRVSNDLKMYAGGFLEGLVSARMIKSFQHNANIGLSQEEEKHHALGNVHALMDGGLQTIRNKSGMARGEILTSASLPVDPWWRQARYALLQSWGILDAYNLQVDMVGGKAMSMLDLMVLSSDGETPELEMAYDMEEYALRKSEHDDNSSDSDADAFLQRGSSKRPFRPGRAVYRSAKRSQREQTIRGLNDAASKLGSDAAWRHIKESSGRCSALVRLTEGGKDLLVGHTTFSDFSEMTRIFKFYDFPLGKDTVQRMGFSSYPGVAGSTDDYYLMDSGLVVTETTISMLTDEPYDKLSDNLSALPDFMRIMLANRLAKTGKDWVDLMQKSATGTYSSQWMVVDYKLFKPGQTLAPGTLWVIEQVPGLSHAEDMTQRLEKQGFWGSENRAYFKGVRDSAGETEAQDLHGRVFSADNNPRAKIFAGTAPHVQTLADMRGEMQRNKWPHEIDGGDDNTPDHAISARGDLNTDHPNPNGGVDSKVTNSCMARKLQADAISGPTHDSQKPFQWTDAAGKELYPGVPHDGMPNLWNFDWVRMRPDGQDSTGVSEC